MNEYVVISKRGGSEIRNYEESDVPFDYYFDTLKKRGNIFLVNKHRDFEMLFITNGSLKIHLDNETFSASENDVIVVNPNVLHNIIPLTDEVRYECIIIDADFLKKYGFMLEKFHVKEKINDSYLFSVISSIKSKISEKPDFYQASVTSELLTMLIRLFEKHTIEKAGESTPENYLLGIEKSISYINKHFNSDISIEEIASHIGYSKFYFCRRFKEVTGYTPATYINMQKIKYAYTKLSESDIPINELAFECGFKSVAYFSVTFKKYTGMNPSEVKKSSK